ncbi:uncharacterized protein LOC130291215 isoform X1 [Hyla sarda]|uniref:uncharacterized protein LOC130291215 isoform X1 n=1 Tax=Hyla sarda TaxID=327740 RepID=UPI0024C388CA|nr:uncharacterized protein LOC130291215 isoform X1 [Hyla sarda]
MVILKTAPHVRTVDWINSALASQVIKQSTPKNARMTKSMDTVMRNMVTSMENTVTENTSMENMGTAKDTRVSTAIPVTPAIPAAQVEVTVRKGSHTEKAMSTRRRKRSCIRRRNPKTRKRRRKNLRRNINGNVFLIP